MKNLVGKIQRKIQWAWRDAFVRRFPDFKLLAGEARVLCFHGVCPDDTAYINGRFMHLTEFRNLLVFLKQHTHVLSAADWKNGKWSQDKMNVLLTFDDGYANNLELALPVLEELELPALWFITGEQDSLHMDLFDIATNARLDLRPLAQLFRCESSNTGVMKRQLVMGSEEDVRKASELLKSITASVSASYTVFWKLLNDAQLESLQNHPLISLGNHTCSHFCLTVQKAETLEREVEFVEQRLNGLGFPSTEFFAVPYGIVNKALLELLQNKKKWCIFVNDVPTEFEGLAYERITVNPFISLKNQVYAIYNGYY